MQPFPDAARTFSYVGLPVVPVMYLEVIIRAVAKELRSASGPKSVSPGNVLFRRQRRGPVKVDCSH